MQDIGFSEYNIELRDECNTYDGIDYFKGKYIVSFYCISYLTINIVQPSFVQSHRFNRTFLEKNRKPFWTSLQPKLKNRYHFLLIIQVS